jgi:N6-adenosine-specific RNA methylase IME4
MCLRARLKIDRDLYPDQGIGLDYPVMSLDDIEKLPVAERADEAGCHLYMWTTHRFLPDALRITEAWGFRYQCLMTWVKPSGFTPYSWMYDTEHVLFARRGDLELSRMGLKLSMVEAKGAHSQKPHVFYDRVVQASPGPRLEMFARAARDGFDAWGNEAPDGP